MLDGPRNGAVPLTTAADGPAVGLPRLRPAWARSDPAMSGPVSKTTPACTRVRWRAVLDHRGSDRLLAGAYRYRDMDALAEAILQGDGRASPLLGPSRGPHRWLCNQPVRRVRPTAPGFPCAAGNRIVLGSARGRFDSCCQSRQRGVASPYAVFDMPAICIGS
jgi:hypothetical protein